MRRLLEMLYAGSGIAAGMFLILIALFSAAQILGRLLGVAAYSLDEFAGYCMAASSFLGLTYTFRNNEHIRVAMLVERLAPAWRRGAEAACLIVALLVVGYFAWFAIGMTWFSYTFGDVSQGLIAVKLWIPQSGMAAGLLVLAVALLDDLIVVLRGGEASYQRAAATRPLSISENI